MTKKNIAHLALALVMLSTASVKANDKDDLAEAGSFVGQATLGSVALSIGGIDYYNGTIEFKSIAALEKNKINLEAILTIEEKKEQLAALQSQADDLERERASVSPADKVYVDSYYKEETKKLKQKLAALKKAEAISPVDKKLKLETLEKTIAEKKAAFLKGRKLALFSLGSGALVLVDLFSRAVLANSASLNGDEEARLWYAIVPGSSVIPRPITK